MVESKNKIQIEINKTDVIVTKGGDIKLGDTKLEDTNENIENLKEGRPYNSKIIIYQKGLETFKDKNQVANFEVNDEKKQVDIRGVSLEEMMGATGTHESVHATEKEYNSNFYFYNKLEIPSKKIESKPEMKEYEYYQQILDSEKENKIEKK